MAKPKKTKVIAQPTQGIKLGIILTVGTDVYEAEGTGENKLKALFNAVSKIKLSRIKAFKGVFCVNDGDKTTKAQLNMRQMRQLFYGGYTSNVLKMILVKRLAFKL